MKVMMSTEDADVTVHGTLRATENIRKRRRIDVELGWENRPYALKSDDFGTKINLANTE